MKQHGMTLIELLVALSCFLILGGGLVMFLNVGLNTWRVGEQRRESYERSQSILDEIADDLVSAYSDPTHGAGGHVDVLFLSDYDLNGRQRVRFVRSLGGDARHPVTQNAGDLTSGDAEYDYFDDAAESAEGRLRATGGLQEVAYVMDPDPAAEMLWRGIRSPIGGAATLFEDHNIYKSPIPNPSMAGAAAARQMQSMRPWGAGVMYIEFNFWGPDTEAWRGSDKRVASTSWDSTLGILEELPGYDANSRHNPIDDIFPGRVQIVLVLRPARVTRLARLSRSISASDSEIPVETTQHYPDGTFQFVKIGDEWISYERKQGGAFSGAERGVRGSVAAEHRVGSPVIYGTTFTRIVRIPTARGFGKVARP